MEQNLRTLTQYLPKIAFSVLITPILASVSFVGLSWTVRNHFHNYCRDAANEVCGRRGRKAKFLSRYLPKIRVPIADFPNFCFRLLPWASVDFRG